MEKGATHYAHVFYPLTGITAEKHDSFLAPTGDGSAVSVSVDGAVATAKPRRTTIPDE